MSRINIIANADPNSFMSERESILDRAWLKNTFILGLEVGGKYSSWLNKNRFFSTADVKFGSTAPGMSMAVNPKPQFTRYCDIRRPGKLAVRDYNNTRVSGVPSYNLHTYGNQYGLGFGRYYSEAIDDNQQRIFLRFGEPQYMSMLFWLGKSFDVNKAILYKRGFISRTFLQAVNLVSKFFAIAKYKWLYAFKIALEAIIQPNRFVSLRDNMYTYWNIVDTILNMIYVRRTKVPFMFPSLAQGNSSMIGSPLTTTKEVVQGLHNLLPGIVDPQTGRISVWTIALRGQAAFNSMMWNDLQNSTDEDITNAEENYRIKDTKHDTYFTNLQGSAPYFTAWLMKFAAGTINEDAETFARESTDLRNFQEVIGGSWGVESREVAAEEDLPYLPALNESISKAGEEIISKPGAVEYADSADAAITQNVMNKSDTWNRYGEYMQSMLTGGAAFAVFNVEATGSIGEVFSNSSEDNPLESAFNAISSKVRSAMNATANMTEIPVVGDLIKTAFSGAAIIASNMTMGMANPLLALMYGTVLALPKLWGNSSASMPRASYKIKLTSPYGNAYSQLFNIFLPMSMLMAATLPRSVGSSTHIAPFMLQLYDRGRVNIPYGMVENLSITRGTSNLAFTRDGNANAIDIDLSIVDLNEIVSLDINNSGHLMKFFDQLSVDFTDSPMLTYINTISGLDVYTQYYTVPNVRLKIAERTMNMKALFTDTSALAAFTVNTIPFLGSIGRAAFENSAVLHQQVSGI